MYRPVQPQQTIPVKPIFFSQKNFDTLENVLVDEFERRNKVPLNDQQIKRLEKTIDHYINEVYAVQGEKPIQILNKEVLSNCAQDFSKYLQRKEVVQNKPAAVKNVMDDGLFQETSQRFERLTQERNEGKALPPSTPDFRISLEEDGPTSVQLFEKARQQRELNTLRSSNETAKADVAMQRFVNADSTFRTQQDAQSKNTELALYERMNRPRENVSDAPLMVLPDRREIFMSPIGSFDTMTQSPMPRELGNANSNPTIVQPEFASPAITNLPQNYVIREEKTVSYKEIENNLIIYSADRDWLRNNKENRYNFTVNFDPANNGQSFGPSPGVQQKFKNIVRIEFVKAILPGEGLDVSVKCASSTTSAYQDNILNFPYITVRIAELENNNFGTDNFLDRSFGVLQYDANWISDTTTTDSRGYVAMIPKFLKCEKVYHPTPLSTLQKLTIDLHRPNGELISDTADTFDIGGILAGSWTGGGATFPYSVTLAPSAYDGVASGILNGVSANGACNFFLNTTSYFSRFQITPGDRIQINGYTYDQATLEANSGLRDFVNWINRDEGHIVLAIGHTNTSGTYADGPNTVGYANFIIIQARYVDPTTGSTNLSLFGPLGGGVDTIGSVLNDKFTNIQTPRRLIDLNKQLSLVFRVITREMDALPQIRPDNNY